jgi:hypothetical protein
MKHSEGKVTVDDLLIKSGYNVIADCGTEEVSDKTYANAERLAALWNAAEGIPTEMAVRYLHAAADAPKLLDRVKVLEDREARMLEAFKTMTTLARIKYGNLDAGAYQEIQAAETLIAEIEGEK